MTDQVVLIAGLLADQTPRDTGPDFGKASPFGLVVVVILLLATFLLVWSMNKQLKKLPESFDPESPEPDQAADEGTVGQPIDPGVAGGERPEPGDQPSAAV
ncbi:hypothetical protein MMAD_42940 [Mycolicibacterium madagascariense]|uniref:Uncharacterized protein n=1 Tax=Mycolicibacterium madagascariense TaxID=212765 RepID=A0A7I7XL79_9MYCO|nr:hypothetical protein [Mycolicibacterium madagascariense]MCV7012324.1 hypothetical protein [Mycolicibacterium madagascariense]BBZ29999.1 hypothetical protein MMAD_42940 [Mycolicibacterium madagascariense]